MPFDPNTFPVAETPENLIAFAVGNLVNVPAGTTCLLPNGRVTRVNRGKPGGTMIVTIEPITADRSAG